MPLNIFEARYRVLFNTLLAGAEGCVSSSRGKRLCAVARTFVCLNTRTPALRRLETDLIDDSSPFKGTRTFGMSLVDGREMASVGTMLHIERHERMPNGTMVILTRGGRRFRVVRVVKQQPVLICEVVWVDDALVDEMGEDDEFTLPELAEEVSTLYRTTVQLSNKVNAGKGEPVVEEVPGEGLSPQEASFWYMRVFSAFPGKQQQLLEMTSTRERLKAVQDVLRETSRYLGATSALKSALQEITNKPSEDTPPQ